MPTILAKSRASVASIMGVSGGGGDEDTLAGHGQGVTIENLIDFTPELRADALKIAARFAGNRHGAVVAR